MIYLDNSATTRTFGSAAEVAKKYMTETYFNPSSAYGPAVTVEKAVNGARRRIADTINVTPNEIIFTSGATESNNMVLRAFAKKNGKYGCFRGAAGYAWQWQDNCQSCRASLCI